MPALDPLDRDILELLDKAKPVVEIEGARKAAIFASVAAKVGVLPPGGGDGGGAGGGAGSTLSTLGGAKAAIVVASTFVLGVAGGVAGDRAFAPARAPIVAKAIAAAATIPSSRATAAAIAPPAEGVPVSALPSVMPAPGALPRGETVVEPAPSSRGLAAERALLDVARGALARGEATEALAAAERHVRTYPDGALVEEREAIAIKSLAALGRRDEAQGRAREFERKYPNSLVLRAVKNAVEAAP